MRMIDFDRKIPFMAEKLVITGGVPYSAFVRYLVGMGWTCVEIAELFKVLPGTIRMHLKRMGVTPAPGRKLYPWATEQMKALYRSGLSYKEIAERTGWGYDTVRKRLREVGMPARSRGRNRKEVDGVEELYASGLPQTVVAWELKVSRSLVQRRLCEAGVTRRPIGAKYA